MQKYDFSTDEKKLAESWDAGFIASQNIAFERNRDYSEREAKMRELNRIALKKVLATRNCRQRLSNNYFDGDNLYVIKCLAVFLFTPYFVFFVFTDVSFKEEHPDALVLLIIVVAFLLLGAVTRLANYFYDPTVVNDCEVIVDEMLCENRQKIKSDYESGGENNIVNSMEVVV